MVNASEEAARLQEIERLGILLDQPDESLQAIVDRVAQVYGVGLCTINLILGDRQVFKAWAGDLPPEMASLRWLDRQKGLCTYVVASHTPLVIEDMAASEEWQGQYFCTNHGVRFYAGVPLVTSHGHALGTLCLADGNPRTLSASELERLQLFARRVAAELQLSGMMEHARLLQVELATTARYAGVLAEMSVHLDEASDAAEEREAQRALETLVEAAGLSWGAVVVVQNERSWAPCAAGALPPELQRLTRGGQSQGGDTLWLTFTEASPGFDSPSGLVVLSMGSVAQASAVLAVSGGDARSWTGHDRHFLENGARMVGAALRRFQRWRDLQTANLTDELTGLRNRRALEQLATDPGDLGGAYTVWVGDLHGFKTLNDTMGHAVGDLFLRHAADALLGQLRPLDARFLFRLGGDEFALALPDPDGRHPGLGDRLREAVARVATEDYPVVDLHLDLGEATVPEEAVDLAQALKLADLRMYEAKR
ncbi:MAG TPA: sensor domain-containing diguanylate cyclase, partial [Thermoanaerobaculia bacterium]|nr:sensor domain-containing diguanylate cyclase [Thermoanaerobaculia bacterium]